LEQCKPNVERSRKYLKTNVISEGHSQLDSGPLTTFGLFEKYSLSFTAFKSYNTRPPQVWCRYDEETGENSSGLEVLVDPLPWM
jgi:hypothetical protein